MSRTKEFANHVVALVAREAEISGECIMSKCRNAEVVDARHTVIHILHDKGIYPAKIASIIGLSTRSVHYAITMFSNRMASNPILRNNYERIKKHIGNTLEISR